MPFKDIQKRRQYDREYHKKHREERIKYSLQYHRDHPESHYRAAKKFLMNLKVKVLTHYGNGQAKCVLCGQEKLTSLSIDHINGGGNKHRKEISNGNINIYDWLIKNKYPKGFRTLCMNCQFHERARIGEESRTIEISGCITTT